MLYCNVQEVANWHDDAEQHSWESNTPSARIDVGDAPRESMESMLVTEPLRTILFAHDRIWDAPHGDPLIKLSPPIMHIVPSGTRLHPALAL
jgi:hypothetical protein